MDEPSSRCSKKRIFQLAEEKVERERARWATTKCHARASPLNFALRAPFRECCKDNPSAGAGGPPSRGKTPQLSAALTTRSFTVALQRWFCHPTGASGRLCRCPAPATCAGTPRFAGFSSPAVPIPANTQCPWYSPVPLAIFHGFQFAFPWNTHLDEEIGVRQAKGITGFNKFLLPRGDKRVPFPSEENGIC